MIVLGVQSTTPSLGVALVGDGRVIEEVILPPSRQHLENLAVTIKGLVDRQSVSLKHLNGIGVAAGPGSFSGIRVGLATVKGMALGLGIPAAGVSTLEILAWQALDENETGVSVIDARRGEVYAAFYQKVARRIKVLRPPALVPTGLLLQRLKETRDRLVLCGDEVLDTRIADFGLVARSAVRVPSPAVCAFLALERIRSGEAAGVHELLPVYIRRSDAEEKRAQSA